MTTAPCYYGLQNALLLPDLAVQSCHPGRSIPDLPGASRSYSLRRSKFIPHYHDLNLTDMQYWIYTPGPRVYYDNFIALNLSACLLFSAFQMFLLDRKNSTCDHTSKRKSLMEIYWALVGVSSGFCTVCYGVYLKPDCLVISILNIFVPFFAYHRMSVLAKRPEASFVVQRNITPALQGRRDDSFVGLRDPKNISNSVLPTHTPPTVVQQSDAEGWKLWVARLLQFLAHISRPIRLLHLIFVGLNAAGAIILATRSRYTGLGEKIVVNVPGSGSQSVNLYCTLNSIVDPQDKPTVWLEGSSSQGILDFFPIQHHLTVYHDIPSCSYDPPSFGKSGALPAKYANHSAWLPALLNTLASNAGYGYNIESQNRTYVGWGSQGVKLAVQHAIVDESSSIVVALDPVPDGVEYLIEQAAHNWTTAERQQYRRKELVTKVVQQRAVLYAGLGWYVYHDALVIYVLTCTRGLLSRPFFKFAALTPITDYFPADQYYAYQKQKWQDPILTRQYYDTLASAEADYEDRFLLDTRLPDRVTLRAVLNPNPVSNNSFFNSIYHAQQFAVLEALGGKNLSAPTWCPGANCTANFPLEEPEFIAGTIARFLGYP